MVSPSATTAPPSPTSAAAAAGAPGNASADAHARADAFGLDRLRADVFGPESGPPLLMLHGWGSSAELMRPAGSALAAPAPATDDAPGHPGFRVHNLDLPGHGRTPEPPEAWGVPEYAALVRRYVEANGIAGCPAIGHSNGGRILLHLASHDETAGLFSKLVLVSPSGVTPQRGLDYHLKTAWIKTLKAPFALLPEGKTRADALAWLRTTVYWRLASSSDYSAAQGVMRETFVKTVTHHLDGRLAQVRVPTLLLWGDADAAVSRYQMGVLEREIPDAGLVVLDGAGHYGYLDAPAVYDAAVGHFLRGGAPNA